MAKVAKWLYWMPRIAAILFIAFITMFSLDVFEPGLSWGEILIGLFMHNIPTLILIVMLIISWKYEIAGAIAFAIAGLAYIVWAAIRTWPQWWLALSWPMIIAVPAFAIGALFWLNWVRKK